VAGPPVARDRSPARQMSEVVESSGPPGGRDAGPGSSARRASGTAPRRTWAPA